MQVVIRTDFGRTIIIDAEPTDTIESIKLKFLAAVKLFIRTEDLNLLYENTILKDNNSLDFYNINDGSEIYVIIKTKEGVKFSVKTFDDKSINFVVNSSNDIKDLNVKVNLQSNCKLLDYKISVAENNSILNLSVEPKTDTELIYIEMGNTIMPLDVPLSTTIRAIKCMIQNIYNHNPDRQRLIFNGHQLADDQTLADYNVKEKDLLRLCLKLSPGGPINMSNKIRIIIKKTNVSIPLEAKLTDTVESIKLRLHKLGCHAPNRQILIYDLKKLQEDKTLSENGIKDNANIILAYHVDELPRNRNDDPADETNIMQVFVKFTGGRTYKLYMRPTDSTENIKDRIEDSFGYPAVKQKLIFDGRSLQNGRTLSEQNITQDSTIRCSIKVTNRNGCAQCQSNKRRLTHGM